MRKGFRQCRGSVRFDINMLENLERQGYKYVQIKGLTSDKRYDYLAPRLLLLVPLKELPADPREKDIYEPIPSPILEQWAKESDDHFKIFIAHPS
jgi:hypothetical protein